MKDDLECSFNSKLNKGLILIVLGIGSVLSGCQRPVADWHNKDNAPVRGLIPYTLSAGESHHGYGMKDSESKRYEGIVLFEYPLD